MITVLIPKQMGNGDASADGIVEMPAFKSDDEINEQTKTLREAETTFKEVQAQCAETSARIVAVTEEQENLEARRAELQQRLADLEKSQEEREIRRKEHERHVEG